MTHGRIDDSRLPHPLTEIHATVHVDNRGFAIQEFKARSNQAQLSLTCSGGMQGSSPMVLEADVSQLPLDEQLRSLAILPGNFQEDWQDLQPEGLVDVNIRLGYDGRAWQPQVRMQCRNVSFAHREFLYRLERERLAGTEGRPPAHGPHGLQREPTGRIVGEVRNPASSPTGWLRVSSDELAIDEKLLRALPPPASRWPVPWT